MKPEEKEPTKEEKEKKKEVEKELEWTKQDRTQLLAAANPATTMLNMELQNTEWSDERYYLGKAAAHKRRGTTSTALSPEGLASRLAALEREVNVLWRLGPIPISLEPPLPKTKELHPLSLQCRTQLTETVV